VGKTIRGKSGYWTSTIKPKTGWFEIDLRELWRCRELIGLFVRRDFVAFYKQTILGPIWFLIQPVLTTVVFTVVFGNIAKISTDGLPHVLFYYSGTIVWSYFAQNLQKTSDTFVANANLFGKVYFPRLTVPISITITNLLTFAIQFSVFVVLLGYFALVGTPIRLSWYALTLPLLLLQMAALGLGTGIIISALTTKYRDLRFLVGFGVQLWMYATPVVYPLSTIPIRWRWVFTANPVAPVVENFRFAFLGVGGVSLVHTLVSLAVTLFILLAGILLFNRVEKTFMDTV
jgi:lipopolysaccharide transport system permease protein